MRLTQVFAMASVTDANYCPDAYYLIMLVKTKKQLLLVDYR